MNTRILVRDPLAHRDYKGKVQPTPKPLAVMLWCIELPPKTCHTILDPFMGSGTTGVACAHLGRGFIGIEREERFFDLACRRIEEAHRLTDEPRSALAFLNLDDQEEPLRWWRKPDSLRTYSKRLLAPL